MSLNIDGSTQIWEFNKYSWQILQCFNMLEPHGLEHGMRLESEKVRTSTHALLLYHLTIFAFHLSRELYVCLVVCYIGILGRKHVRWLELAL